MSRGKNKKPPEVNSGSMADIAFLLLIFFLVTTTIANDKGLLLRLPPPPDPNQEQLDIKIPDRAIFTILANSKDQLLVEGEPFDGTMDELKDEVKKFILNFGNPTTEGVRIYNTLPSKMKAFVTANGRNPESSDDPTNLKAIVSFKSARGTSYDLYIGALDAMNAAYNEIYAKRVGITAEEWLTLDRDSDLQRDLYERGRDGIPRAISIAEPD